jgi:tRNA G10  N-methylase Trm11
MKIPMSKQEQADFEKMSAEDQQKFVEKKRQKRERLGTKTVILATLLIESLDDVEEFNLFRHKLKQSSKSYKKECEKFLDDLFKNKELTDDKGTRLETAEFIFHSTKAADQELEKLLTLLYPEHEQ